MIDRRCRLRGPVRDGQAACAALCVLALALAGGCASMPPADELQALPAALPHPSPGVPGDARAAFRAVFCEIARQRTPDLAEDDCAGVLWRLPDEPPMPAARPPRDLNPALRVLVVGGAFSDCYGGASVAWRQAIERLSAAGHRVEALPISGRSGADHNARLIAEALAVDPLAEDERVVMVGYSKGTVDILHFLATYPDRARAVDAVVSVAGPVHGSRVADRGAWLYDTFLKRAFSGRCAPGDGGVVDSLRVEDREAWLAEHGMPTGIRYYSLVAFTTREHLARGLRSSWRVLAREDVRNDGQVSVAEGLLPGSTLLAYPNADHWSLAIDIEDELGFLAGRRDARRYPRDVLFEAIVHYVDGELASDASAGAAGEGP